MTAIREDDKILLLLMPFWDPQIPPLGLACLKSYLRQYNYNIKTVDANLEMEFRETYDNYYRILQESIPPDKQGNIFNIGNQVLRNHLTAHINRSDEVQYIELVKLLAGKTFYCDIPGEAIRRLNGLMEDFYNRLRDYVSGLLNREKPRVLGLSVYGDTLGPSLFTFKLAKELMPAVRTVMGGGIFADQLAPGSPELDFFVEKTGHYIDKIIIGEGEGLFLRFLRGQLDESQKVYGMKDIPEAVLDISSAAIPDFLDFDLQYYPHLAHYGARSCPFQCKFCAETVNWGKYRKKDAAQTAAEFIEMYKRYSCQLFLLTDSTLNPIAADLSREVIKSGVSIYWDGFLRADRHVCDTENTLLWRRGGFYRAKLGLESGSQRVLELMDKRISAAESETALASLAYAGIKTTTFWLFGFPGETEEDFQATLDFIEKCKDNIYEADCNAYNYYLTGQVNSEEWLKNNKGVLLYPEWARDMVVTQTWVLEGEPSRETAYRRINRFIAHCSRLGIPNPYKLNDVYKADERWKRLHKNAVPPLIELKNEDAYIDENKHVKKLVMASGKNLESEDFDF
ncbi:MAG: radical SAM protein [Candidatus Aminicenantes bacterium]|nr:radical SAM protein [Candidatus Aminicenantes bacterium]NIQ73476.1 radical SAM protein [Candidatus Aminicenantes bacterium]NIT29545.1 radical SAM protein [Candidatus Aminicenantes bacterium]